ncbi:MAG: hypothetical protein M3Y82_00290, partial [Verrucomicrobiota bacterium]|nr:hypothetical protein [Verrucomicrobiota bacterium]
MKKLPGLLVTSFLLTLIAPAAWAGTYSFANTNDITINDLTTAPTEASPYPSVISVVGIPPNEKIDKITVTFHNLFHSISRDIDILLVGPSGENLILFSDVGGSATVSGVTVTLDDDAAATLPPFGVIVSGLFKPDNFEDGEGGDTFRAPAPFPSSATNLSVFKGTNPNGFWRLFVVDDFFHDFFFTGGGMADGWSMTIRTAALFTNSTF